MHRDKSLCLPFSTLQMFPSIEGKVKAIGDYARPHSQLSQSLPVNMMQKIDRKYIDKGHRSKNKKA